MDAVDLDKIIDVIKYQDKYMPESDKEEYKKCINSVIRSRQIAIEESYNYYAW